MNTDAQLNAGKLAYSMNEAAAALGMTRSRLYDAISAGEVDSYKLGRRRMFSRRALEDYVRRMEAEARAAA